MTDFFKENHCIYLDWNVFVKLRRGEWGTLRKYILEVVRQGYFSHFYTEEHLMEASAIFGMDEPEKNKLLAEELSFISLITSNLYAEKDRDSDKYQVTTAHPAEVHKQKSFAFDVLRAGVIEGLGMSNFSDRWNEFIHPKLTAEHLNNYPANELIDVINALLKDAEIAEYMDRIRPGISTFDELVIFANEYNSKLLKQPLNLLSDKISAAYFMLDALGFRSEKRTNNHFWSAFLDVRHSFHAAHAYYFITDDKKLRYKAEVVYKWAGICTKVMRPDEVIAEISS